MTGIMCVLAAGGGAATAVVLNGASISSGTYVYNNSNTANTLQVTGSPVAVTFRVWGAAGGNGSYGGAYQAGSGGYAKGTVTLQPGTTYYLYVGQGGFGPATASYGNGGLGGWPNGGYGTMGDASGAGGGGMSLVSTATFSTGMANADILIIAGGGGGTTGYAGNAGAGGGTTGQNSATGRTGGTQSGGGTYNGAKLAGGNATGSRTSGTDDGGGGGGGWYGGGGGTSDATPGAGGSGYYNSSLVSSATLSTGNYATAPDPDGLLPAGYATGRTDGGTPQNGRPGIMYLTFTL